MNKATLADGRRLRIEVLECPLASEDQRTLISLWRSEWRKADYDWIQSMNGDYSDSLSITSVVGRVDGAAAGTASVCYPRIDSEVAVVGSVLTHPEFRRLGVAQHLTRAVTDRAFAAGCSVSYLGATPMPQSVYLRCGYRWHNGGVMRHAAPEAEDMEAVWYAGGQSTAIRPAVWGDLSGFACLVVQPLSTWVLDYLRGYLSGRYVSLMRCVSNFPNLYYDVLGGRGGQVLLDFFEMVLYFTNTGILMITWLLLILPIFLHIQEWVPVETAQSLRTPLLSIYLVVLC